MPNGISHRYQLEQSIFVLRDVGWYFSLVFKFKWNFVQANSRDTDQTQRFAASGLGLHCLPMSHKKDARLRLKRNVYHFKEIVLGIT